MKTKQPMLSPSTCVCPPCRARPHDFEGLHRACMSIVLIRLRLMQPKPSRSRLNSLREWITGSPSVTTYMSRAVSLIIATMRFKRFLVTRSMHNGRCRRRNRMFDLSLCPRPSVLDLAPHRDLAAHQTLPSDGYVTYLRIGVRIFVRVRVRMRGSLPETSSSVQIRYLCACLAPGD